MSVDKSKIDYDRLLNDWAEMVFAEADKCMGLSEEVEVGSYRSGLYDGMYRGYVDAIARLSLMENRKYKKYLKVDSKEYKGIDSVLEDILIHDERGE